MVQQQPSPLLLAEPTTRVDKEIKIVTKEEVCWSESL